MHMMFITVMQVPGSRVEVSNPKIREDSCGYRLVLIINTNREINCY